MATGTWVLERCDNDRFPYRVQILGASGEAVLCLRVQDRWPTANRNIFCLREGDDAEAIPVEELERVRIVAMQRRGVRLSVVLDRARYKRCDFLFVTRAYKSRPEQQYEQIFWQTQTSLVQHRPKVPLLNRAKTTELRVVVDSREKYPWRFSNAAVERRRLDCGDYALAIDDEIAAIVERKTFENLLADISVMPLLHQRLAELSTHEFNALVVEAQFEDFLNPKKLHHYSPSYCANVIAELYATHPRLRIVFCGNRKSANLWTASFFAAVQRTKSATGK